MPQRDDASVASDRVATLPDAEKLQGWESDFPKLEGSSKKSTSELLHGDPGRIDSGSLAPEKQPIRPLSPSATAMASALFKARPGHAVKSAGAKPAASQSQHSPSPPIFPSATAAAVTAGARGSDESTSSVQSAPQASSPVAGKSIDYTAGIGPFGEVPTHYGHIVVLAVDESDASWHAFQYAVERLLHLEDTVILVHVFSPLSLANSDINEMGYIGTDMWDALSKEHEALAQQILQRYVRVCKDKHIKYATRTYEGEAREYICKIAEDVNAKMVIVGSRGQNAFKRFFLGSVSDYIVHNCTRPVLVVRNDASILPKSRRSSI